MLFLCFNIQLYIFLYWILTFPNFIMSLNTILCIIQDFMKTAIVPIIKNKSGNTSDKSNYRPIALVTSCLKIFESCL